VRTDNEGISRLESREIVNSLHAGPAKASTSWGLWMSGPRQ
jgi:hypothetical protein